MNIIALIPARGGSKRIPGKNVRPLNGHPLLFYTIAAAKESKVFSEIFVSSDDPRICYMAALRGVSVVPRPDVYAIDTSPDIEWVDCFFKIQNVQADAFAILRPTSPFRSAKTIRRAWKEFKDNQPCDSIRAVSQGPDQFKIWIETFDKEIRPLWSAKEEIGGRSVPRHSMPSQMNHELITTYKQNASLEISWTRNVLERGSISGDRIKPFFTQGYEGFDLNTELDWLVAETIIERGLASLPEVK